MVAIRVTAPYVTLKVAREEGSAVLGFYEGAVLAAEAVDPDQLKRHLDRGMVEKVDENAADVAPDRDDGAPPPNPAGVAFSAKAPGKNEDKAAWVDYAVARGMSREEAEATTKADLVEVLSE